MVVTTFVAIGVLVVGLLIGWPVLVALSAIFVAVQLLMIGARAAVESNDRRLAARLTARQEAHNDEG
ncbi:MAG: hypothetical protein HN979_01420 [Actinobacteria bacterium]|jgi:divalent metal cation (Fe/Co/Zn/Cd) transporter|nr:hypothetical protein [Actinomycetota bacterium]MBT3686793.1 hypothetical protein [Actinomycetota bacterium]MBT4037130.1 hypothetical protein [Actinomycetota bacterium]MBT4278158.1 hypothetical protein [Actinomycetota bacterium]MBT4343802.1 hypothetical protein [Actinomycetota bacterium]